MTLSNNVHDDLSMVTSGIFNNSSNWNSLYCSHLWSNSHLRNAIINSNQSGNKMIKYCYKCNGKIRKYEIQPPRLFSPNNHSTPNRKEAANTLTDPEESLTIVTQDTRDTTQDKPIPTISRNIDTISRPKFISYEPRPKTHRRLRKGLKGIGCAVSLSLTDSPVKKRTQIQACSISVMIMAIVVISFVLVNFTSPYYKNVTYSSTAVPILPLIGSNQTVFAVTVVDNNVMEHEETSTSNFFTSTAEASPITTEENTKFVNLLTKIRNSLKTYPKDGRKKNARSDGRPKEINNRDLSVKFCSCQNNEVCMLDEDSGTAICKKAVDTEDPTGCGGLCALETEACQLVDRARGVRVCRLITLMRCTPQQWRCRNGLCVDASARCDGKMQCYDKSDEINCECDLSKEFHCGHSLSCFPNTKLCDGVIDCWDAIDEVNCTAVCPDSQFTCTNGQCIPISRFCDGLEDCNDGSDEPQGCDGACSSREKPCKNKRCVPKTVFCDGTDNCGDGSDELNCYSKT